MRARVTTGLETAAAGSTAFVFELELIQSHMAQKPVLRDEVGCACVAREVSVERGVYEKGGRSLLKFGFSIFV